MKPSHRADDTDDTCGEMCHPSEDQCRAVLNSMRDAIHVVDPDLVVLLVNEPFETWCAELGVPLANPIGKPLVEICPYLSETAKGEYQRVFESGEVLTTEEVTHLQGRTIATETRKIPILNGQRVVRVVTVIRDVTERKRAEQSLRESEERFRVLSEATFEGVIFSEDGILRDTNQAFLDIVGYTAEEAVGKPIVDFIAPEHHDRVLQTIESGFTGVFEHKGVHKDGHLMDLEVHGHEITYQGRKMRMTAVRDVTARKRTERTLFEYQQQLKSLAHQLTLTEEQEKRRIAEQLHDDLGQCLAFCKMKVQLAINAVSTPPITDELQTVCDMLTQSMDHIKNLTYDLTSPVLQELGFEKAMDAWLKDDVESQHAVKTRLIVDHKQAVPTDDTLKAFLFRSTRELVVNSLKHAKPDTIIVRIGKQDETISVCVEDDGAGFDPEHVEANSRKGFGLFSIRERLDYLGGGLELLSSPGQGCKAVLNVPVR